MAKKFNDSTIATITVLNDADMMSTFDAVEGELSKITIANMKAGGFGRFGVSGEDDTAAQDRDMDMQGYNFTLNNSGIVDLIAGDSTFTADTGEVRAYPDSVRLYAQSDADHYSAVVATAPALNFGSGDGSSTTNISVSPTQILISLNNAGSQYLPLSVNNTFADSAGNIPLVGIADDFLNDAAAAIGGIAVGGLYHTSGVVKIRLS